MTTPRPPPRTRATRGQLSGVVPSRLWLRPVSLGGHSGQTSLEEHVLRSSYFPTHCLCKCSLPAVNKTTKTLRLHFHFSKLFHITLKTPYRTYCFDPTSNLVSWFLPKKTKSRRCFPQSCLNIVLVWDLGEMFKKIDCLADQCKVQVKCLKMFDCLADQLSNGHEIPDKLGQESRDKFDFLRKLSSWIIIFLAGWLGFQGPPYLAFA